MHSSLRAIWLGERAVLHAAKCIIRESLYVLGNDTIVRPQIHHTDTHGATHQIFGLFRLLGLSLPPRLAKLRHQCLVKLNKDRRYGNLEPLFDGSVPEELIREPVRCGAAMRPPDGVLQRLANASGADRLAKALMGIGKVNRSASLSPAKPEQRIAAEILRPVEGSAIEAALQAAEVPQAKRRRKVRSDFVTCHEFGQGAQSDDGVGDLHRGAAARICHPTRNPEDNTAGRLAVKVICRRSLRS